MIQTADRDRKADWVRLNAAFVREEQTGEDDPRLLNKDLNHHFGKAFDFLVEKPACQLLLWYEAEEAVAFVTIVTYPSAWSGGWAVFVDDLYVLPAYRRRGIATALLQAVDHHAQEIGAKRLQLLVSPDNPAHALYAGQGYAGMALDFLLKYPAREES